jgi:hypothetical protein
MGLIVGVNAAGHIAAAPVEGDKVAGTIYRFPQVDHDPDSLSGMHADEIAERIHQQIINASDGRPVDSVVVAFPGIIRG